MSFSASTLPPNKAQPWRLSEPLYERISLRPKEQGLEYRRCVVLPSDSDFDFVWNAFYSNKPSKYGIRRIFAIHHGGHNASFEEELFSQEGQSKNLLFNPNWSDEDPTGQRRRIIERWRGVPNRYTSLSLKNRMAILDKTSVFPLWHGFQAEGKGVSICNTGFEIPGKHDVGTSALQETVTDPGFFGSGIYFAREARYAVDIYSKNSGHVLLAWVSMREPYPVTREDFASEKLLAKGHVGFYNAHYIPVVSKNPSNPDEANYYPASLGEIPQYDEIVVFQKSQTLPRFWVELQPDLPFEPSTSPSSNGALADFIFKVLEQSLIQNDHELRNLLKEKSRALLIHGEKSSLPPSEDEFYTNICELFKVQGQINLLARNYLIEIGKNTSKEQQPLPDTVASIRDYLEQGLFQEAWEDLCLAGDALFENFDPVKSPIYELIIQVLPHIGWESKVLLFDKIITPLRILGSKTDLELSLGRWFSQSRHEKFVREENWHRELRLPALACYGKALALSDFERDKKPIYREASLLISKPIFNSLSLLDQSISKAIEKQDVNSLKRLLQLLSKIRKYFCLSEEDRGQLVPLYKKMKEFLYKITLSSPESSLLKEGVTTDKGPFPLPYMQLCSEVLSSWETTFKEQEVLILFFDLLKDICPGLEEKEIESFFSFLIPSVETESFFSPPFLLKRFLEARRENQDGLSLLEIAFHRASLEDKDFSYLIPLIESAAKHLLSKNSPDEEILKLYKILSTGPTNSPFREVFVKPFSKTRKALFNQMASIRSRSGSRLSTLFEKEALVDQLFQLTQEEPSPVAIKGAFETAQTVRYLKSSLIQKLIDVQGNIKKSYPDSLHSVSRLQEEGVDLHFKQKPSHPLLEYAIYSLASRLSGRGVPPSQLVRFEVTLPGSSTKIYPVLISQTVEGRNLSDVLKENPSFTPDQKQLTEMTLLGLLTRPGDGRAGNFIVTPKNELYSIDNDISFVEPIVKGLIGETVNFCSILHYLPSALDLSVVEDWRTFSPSLLFAEWLQDLADREQHHLSLFSEIERKRFYEEDKNLQFVPQLLLKAGVITTVYTQFDCLLSLDVPIDFLNLLTKLITLNDTGSLNQTGDRLYLAYTKGQGSPAEKLRIATSRKKEQSMTTPQAFKASVGKVPTLDEIEKREVFSLDKVKEEFLAYSLLRQGEVTLRGSEGKQVLEVDFSKIQKNGKPDLEREELMLKGLSLLVEKNPPQTFIIKNSSVLTVEKLKPFLHPTLLHLELHNCSSLLKIGDIGLGILPSTPLILPPTLKTVEFVKCAFLTSIQIQASQVESIKISGSPKLSSVLFDIQFFSKIKILDLPREAVDKMLERMVGQKVASYDRILMNSESIRNLMAFERASLKKEEWSIASLTLDLVERNHGGVLTPLIPKEKPDLSFLSLVNMEIDIRTVEVLLGFMQDFQVKALELSNNNMGNEAVKALAVALTKSQVTHLDLHSNNISDEGAIALAIALPKSHVARLDLKWNHVDVEGAKALAESLPKSHVTHLNLELSEIGAEGAKAFAAALPTCRLTSLDLGWNNVRAEGAKALAESLPKSQLNELNLESNGISDEGAKDLAEYLPLSQLTHLDLQWNNIRTEGAKALAESLPKSKLNELNLKSNEITDEGVKALSEYLPLSQLTNLNLGSNEIGAEGARTLGEFLSKSKLANLNLQYNNIRAEGAKALAESLPKSQLTNLDLYYNNIGDEGAKALAESLSTSQLTYLDLQWNNISDEGAKALAESIPTSQLTDLYLQKNQIGAEGAKALAKSIPTSQLTNLNLYYNNIGNEGTKAIAESFPESQLTYLNLQGNQISDEGAKALAKTLPKSKLSELNLGSNEIGAEGAKALAEALPKSKLNGLNLGSNEIGAEGAKALADTLPKSQITALDLERNLIGDKGAKALAEALPSSHLDELNLYYNNIGVEGAKALAVALPNSRLTYLNLQENQIGAEGAKALAAALPKSQLTQLDLQWNNIGVEGVKAFAAALPASQVTELNLEKNLIASEGAKALNKLKNKNGFEIYINPRNLDR